VPRVLRGAIRGAAPTPAAMPAPEPGVKGFLLRHRTFLLLVALVLQKCVTDVLTNLTRRTSTYSATSVALLSEVAKFPLLIVAVALFGGGWKRVAPTLRNTVSDRPFSLVWVSLCYSVQNVLYFLALSHLSAESYQVLSQSKLLFTAGLMMGIMQTRLRLEQWSALGMLIGGSLLVQLSEASRAVVAGGNAYLGGLWAILGSLLSSLPNVYYEKLLKEKGTDEWARNIQMTFWIFLWILASMCFEGNGLRIDLSGFSLNVWLIIALKALNCLLIPATLKYADNILYSYAKPTSIVLTCALSSIVSGACARARGPPSRRTALLHVTHAGPPSAAGCLPCRHVARATLRCGHGPRPRLYLPVQQPRAKGQGRIGRRRRCAFSARTLSACTWHGACPARPR